MINYKRILKDSHQLYCVANLDGYFLWLNPVWQRTLGWTRKELKARPFIEFVHPDDVESTMAEVATLGDGVPTINFVNRYRHKAGHWVHLEWVATPYPDGTLYCSARDVTTRMLESRELREKVELLEMAEELAQVGHWRVNLETGELHWSPQVYRIHGIEPDGGRPPIEAGINFYHEDDRPTVEALVSRAIETGQGFNFQLRLIRADGEERLVESIGRTEKDAEGKVDALIGVFQDVTDRFNEFRRSNEALDEFAYAVAHDLAAPLKSIQGLISLLELEMAGTECSTGELLQRIQKSSRQMQRLIDELYQFARVTGADRELSWVNLNSVVADVALALDAQIKESSATVRVDNLPIILGQRQALVALFQNLVSNAIKYRAPERAPEITFETRADRDEVSITVSDNGRGFDEKHATRILRPFQRLGSDDSGSLGMGLAICVRVARMHSGRLDVASEPGIGSRFSLVVPRSKFKEQLS